MSYSHDEENLGEAADDALRALDRVENIIRMRLNNPRGWMDNHRDILKGVEVEMPRVRQLLRSLRGE